jgi:hypothetical protein
VGTEYTVVNYVVEYRLPGKPWLIWPQVIPVDEQGARAAYRAVAGSPRVGRLQYRLVRRVAVITDEVIAATRTDSEPPVMTPCATKNHQCPECRRSFRTHKGLVRHYDDEHPGNPGDIRQVCDV